MLSSMKLPSTNGKLESVEKFFPFVPRVASSETRCISLLRSTNRIEHWLPRGLADSIMHLCAGLSFFSVSFPTSCVSVPCNHIPKKTVWTPPAFVSGSAFREPRLKHGPTFPFAIDCVTSGTRLLGPFSAQNLATFP